MTPPPELFPGVGWFLHDEFDGAMVYVADIGEVTRYLHVYEDGSATVTNAPRAVGHPFKTVDQALAWLRSRLRSLRDELNRLDPPETRWVPVGECGELVTGTYTTRVHKVADPETAYFDGRLWLHDCGVDLPVTHILCLGSTPIRIPEEP